ncbi:MAG: hypothetical protein K2P93_09080 [Alphaproteobacteria bacterium]|nr:hypothetical protein [Alphaproteobacteria bacterium]
MFFNTKKPAEIGIFRRDSKSKYKNIDFVRVQFEEDRNIYSQENAITIKFSNEDIMNIITKINQRKIGKFIKYKAKSFKRNQETADSQMRNYESSRKSSKFNYRYLFNLAEDSYPNSSGLIFDLGVLSQANRQLLGSFFQDLSEKGRLRDEVHFTDKEGNYVRITPHNIERLNVKNRLNLESDDKESILQAIWEKCFTDNITHPKLKELYINKKQDEVMIGFHQYRHKLRIYFDNIRTSDHTAIVRAFFNKLAETKHFSGEVHVNVVNGERFVIAKDRIAVSSPKGFGLQIGGINYTDYLEGYLSLLPKKSEGVEELSTSPFHVSDDETSQPPSRRLSESEEFSEGL